MTEEKTKPIEKYTAGRFDAAIWSQPSKIEGGGDTFSITLRKSWTKDGKNWDEAKISVFPRELPDLMALLQKVHEDMRVKKKE